MKKTFVCLFVFVTILTGCSKEVENVSKNKPEGESFSHGQVTKSSIRDQEDGWIYMLSITSEKEDTSSEETFNNYDLAKDFVFSFTGINLKYKEIEGSGNPIINPETNGVEGSVNLTVPALSVIDGYKQEVVSINEYFNTKKLVEPIKVENLDGLNVNLIDKNLLVNMYNEALAYTPEKFGAFAFIPWAMLIQQKSDSEIIQGGYMTDYGKITRYNFEIISSDGYTSDKIIAGTAKEEEVKLQENLNQLAQEILNTQVFTCKDIKWKNPEIMNASRLAAIEGILERQYKGEQFGVPD